MTSLSASPTTRRRRNTYAPEFKAQAVAACQQPGVSIAAIALAHQLNANVLRRWVKEHEPHGAGTVIAAGKPAAPGIVPVALQPVSASTEFHCEIRHRHAIIHTTWPTAEAMTCARWLRELLQ